MTTKTRNLGSFFLRSTSRAIRSTVGISDARIERVALDHRARTMTPYSLFQETCDRTLRDASIALKKVSKK